MMVRHRSSRDRLHDLLAARALGTLAPPEQTDLQRLLASSDSVDLDTYDEIAALLDPALDALTCEPTAARASGAD